MSIGLALALAGLALIDSTSFGTLVIPIWLLLTPGKLRGSRMSIYLASVAVAYLVIGLTLTLGADVALSWAHDELSRVPSATMRIIQLGIGVAIIALSYWLEARARQHTGRPGRLQAWRARALTDGDEGGAAGLTKLAVTATALEVATMLPYLVAIGLLTSAGLGLPAYTAVLAGYCLLMIAPAIILTVLRIACHERVDPVLQRLNDWLTRNNAKAIGWAVGGIGIGVAVNAIINLVLVT